MAISSSGNFVVSASRDKTLRLWEKTDEILVLSEEREMVSSGHKGLRENTS